MTSCPARVTGLDRKLTLRLFLKEIQAVKDGKERKISTVFIGGGTPSVLRPDLMGEILLALHENFFMEKDAEISMEANPGTLTKEKLETYRKAGVNRLSIGLQSPKEEELKLLGRIHTYREFLESYEMARNAGFSNINVDLMCALPGQTYENWMENLKTVAELGPEHISAYSLIVEEGTPFAKRNLDLPDEDTEYRMYEDTAPFLKEYGYDQYEISNYAKPGRECRHNVGYWKRTDYLGLGLGAASLMGAERFSNISDRMEYLEKSREPDFPENVRTERTSLCIEDAMAEFMFLGLRMTKGVKKTEFETCFGCSPEKIYGTVIEKHKKLGLLEEADERIFLTRKGIHVSNPVMADFLL